MNGIGTLRRTRGLLDEADLHLKKGLGQNFLVDGNYLRKIAAAGQLDRQTAVLEIGPGIGSLTEFLAEKAGKVVAIEIDGRLLPLLQQAFEDCPHVEWVHADVLKLDLEALESDRLAGYERWGVVSNLPYYITTPILTRLLLSPLHYDFMVVMMQKEVAQRIGASPGGKEYSSLSVLAQFFCEVSRVCEVPPSAFYPPPKVVSQVLLLRRRHQPVVSVNSQTFFFELVRAAFAQRRKTIMNNLLHRYRELNRQELQEVLADAGIDPGRRGETLSLEEFAMLSNRIQAIVEHRLNQ